MSNTDHDPVEDFFGRERDQIVSHDGSDLHWQGILRQARTQRRSRFLGYAAGVAAAALVIGGVSYGAVLRNDSAPPLIAATHDGETAATSAPGSISMGQATPGTSASPSVGQTPVPKSFALLSVSNVGGGNLFVLGSISCDAGRCPVLIGSTDNGRSWHLVSSLTNNSSSVHDLSTGMAANEVTEVRFANTKVGWVYGPDLQYTTDGGRTFRPYGHLGQTVLDVETDGSQVIVTSTGPCAKTATTPCTAGHVARASISASGATTEVGTGAALSEFEFGEVEFDGKQPYVSTGGAAPQRITAGGLVPLGKLGDTCGGVIGQRVIATADPQGGLLAFCPALGGAAAGSIGMSVLSSNDQGRSWVPVSSGALVMGINSPRSFAAANARDLLAVSGGGVEASGHGSMRVSHDGGKTWRAPASPPPPPAQGQGWAWAGAPGGKTFYAISDDAIPAFWKSDDSGETWTKVDLTS